ncbi:MAG: hypothetical protein A4S08_07480 [Proteobacteria bacterium SG_bin4]|nr:MAG: hypothetical protein A4S08_07480 [Proteobacteria bacterium SG_bin4]
MNIDIEGHEYLCYVPSPWAGTGQDPLEWFRENFLRFAYSQKHILDHAVPYELGDGPNRGGVYFLVAEEKIVYVGKANSVQARLIQHWRDRKLFSYYWCFGGMPELFVEDIETFYIYYLEPELNEKRPLVNESFVKAYVQKAKTEELFHV